MVQVEVVELKPQEEMVEHLGLEHLLEVHQEHSVKVVKAVIGKLPLVEEVEEDSMAVVAVVTMDVAREQMVVVVVEQDLHWFLQVARV
jgi:hypothetical protein